jgi:hypothetical protein
MQSAQNLSASGGTICCVVIYKDIENYVVGTDGKAVQAFLSGWATTLHASGYQAAVYGNPGPASTNFSKVSPALDDVQIAKVSNPPQASTWGLWTLGGKLDTTLWTKHQRIHQYWNDHKETHGGVAPPAPGTIDSDIEDATIVASTAAVKTYSWTWTQVYSPYIGNKPGYGNEAWITFWDVNDDDQVTGVYLSYLGQSGQNYSGLTSAFFTL